MGRYGVRGQAILLCSLIWALMAASAILPLQNPPPRGLMHYAVPHILLRSLGLPYVLADIARCIVWAGPALFAVFAARHARRSNIALGLLYVPAAGYALSYAGSFVMWLCFGSGDGNYRGLTSAGFYVALCLLIRIIARIPAHAETPLTGPPLNSATDLGGEGNRSQGSL